MATQKYYIIESEYVGPINNKIDMYKDTRVLSISTVPGKTNMSKEIKTDGWLGTTNDISLRAHGEYNTLDEARAEAERLGFTEPVETSPYDEYEGIIEKWVTVEGAKEHWNAKEWFGSNFEYDKLFAWLNLNADSTDDDVLKACDIAEEAAAEAGVVLHDTYEALVSWRDDLRYERWMKAAVRP